MASPQFSVYAIPALLTLVAKAGIFFYAKQSRAHNLSTRIFLLFLFCLAIQNLSEITFFSAKAANLPVPPAGRIYFAASILALALFLHLSWLMAQDASTSGKSSRFALLIYVPALLLQALLWNGPSLIAGFAPQNYTYTKVAGPLYFLFEAYTVTYLCSAAALFAYGAFALKASFQRSQNKLLLAGLLPPALLIVAIVSLQRFGFTLFNTTTTLPVAMTFFLAVTAYATHQYRPFDIDFFLPWSKVRKRKTEFYKRIQATVGAIVELRSVREVVHLIADTLQVQLALVGGPQPVLALPKGQDARSVRLLSQFPLSALSSIEHIVVTHEIADYNPQLHQTMQRYRVGAIVPFRSYSRTGKHWLILGDHFTDEVYTRLDFKAVEALFAALAERFLDDFLQVRSRLHRLQEQLQRKRRELGVAWHKEHEAKRALQTLHAENDELRTQIARLQDSPPSDVVALDASSPHSLKAATLREHLRESEREAVRWALEQSWGNEHQAAKALGISLENIARLMKIHRLTTKD